MRSGERQGGRRNHGRRRETELTATGRVRQVVRGAGLLAAAVLLATGPACAQASGLTGLDRFAQCLAKKKATMYGSFLCPHCDDQRKLFGRSFAWVPYVECSVAGSRKESSRCQTEHIRFTPTWVFEDGGRLEGVQTLERLGARTGCPAP